MLKDKPIVRFRRWYRKGWEWIFCWRKEWFEWEKSMVEDFMARLSQVSLHRDKENLWLCNNPLTYRFSVKSAYT